MNLYQSLLNTFGTDEPIMSNEITFKDYSKPWIYKELNKLCEEGKLIRYERGIYYIPTKTVFGPSILDPYKVIVKKYIFNGTDTIGYLSGVALLNRLKLTTQMSNVIEVYTNNEPSNTRDITVGKQRVILRKSRTSINSSNAAVLSFLELMNAVPSEFLDDEKKPIVEQFIDDNGITRSDITKYAPLFPDRALRTLVESEVIYSVAQ